MKVLQTCLQDLLKYCCYHSGSSRALCYYLFSLSASAVCLHCTWFVRNCLTALRHLHLLPVMQTGVHVVSAGYCSFASIALRVLSVLLDICAGLLTATPGSLWSTCQATSMRPSMVTTLRLAGPGSHTSRTTSSYRYSCVVSSVPCSDVLMLSALAFCVLSLMYHMSCNCLILVLPFPLQWSGHV